MTTRLDHAPAHILEWFVRRWTMEVTFEEARARLGIETHRQWSDLAIGRTTPALFGLYSLVTLRAHALRQAESRSEMVKIPRSVLERLTDTVCYAA